MFRNQGEGENPWGSGFQHRGFIPTCGLLRASREASGMTSLTLPTSQRTAHSHQERGRLAISPHESLVILGFLSMQWKVSKRDLRWILYKLSDLGQIHEFLSVSASSLAKGR